MECLRALEKNATDVLKKKVEVTNLKAFLGVEGG